MRTTEKVHRPDPPDPLCRKCLIRLGLSWIGCDPLPQRAWSAHRTATECSHPVAYCSSRPNQTVLDCSIVRFRVPGLTPDSVQLDHASEVQAPAATAGIAVSGRAGSRLVPMAVSSRTIGIGLPPASCRQSHQGPHGGRSRASCEGLHCPPCLRPFLAIVWPQSL